MKDVLTESILKNLISAELHTLELVTEAAKLHGISESHSFIVAMRKLISKVQKDLIEATL